MASPIVVGIYKNYYLDVAQLTPEQVCVPGNVPLTYRPFIDLNILCKALASQGIKPNIKLVPYLNNRRNMANVERGDIDIMLPAVWRSDIDSEQVNHSVAVLQTGQFYKGIYVHEQHPLLGKEVKDIDFSQYTGASVKRWKLDWAQLENMTYKRIDVGYLPALFGLLQGGRVDFTILEFPPGRDLIHKNASGIRLRPLEGIKIVLPDSRHFAVSKHFEHNEQFIELLNHGIQNLHQHQTIYKMYQKAGIFPLQAENWKVVPMPQ